MRSLTGVPRAVAGVVLAAILLGAAEPLPALAQDGVSAESPRGPSPSRAGQRILELVEAERYGEAETLLRRAVAGRSAPQAEYLLGWVLMRQLRFDEAAPHLEIAVAAQPSRVAWLHTLAGNLLEQGRCQAALKILDRCLAQDPQPAFHFDKAQCAFRLGDQGLARRELETGLALIPPARRAGEARAAQALYQLGDLYLDEGDAESARSPLAEAVALAPGDAEARYALGLAQARTGATAAAVEAFRAVLDQIPAHTGALYNLGRALRELGASDESRRVLLRFQSARAREEILENHRHYLQLNPTDLDARAALARLLLDTGYLEEAEDVVRQGLRADPQNAAGQELLAEVQRLRGRAPGAAEP